MSVGPLGHHQPEIMEVIEHSRGVINFTALAFLFQWDRQSLVLSAGAFQLELGPSSRPNCLLLFPLPREVAVVEIEPDAALSRCCVSNPELQERLAAEFTRDHPQGACAGNFC